MPENKWELLSPAGSLDALKAALANGADAAYLGAAAFGARSGAGFDPDTLREALRLAHLHRRRIYVTVNILAKQQELGDIRKTLSLLDALGADGVLVQDLGVLKICREEFPSLPLHASTQMALHNASGAELMKRLGAKRAVMARECSLEELKKAAETGLEIEAFCHGALCVSCSGQCLFSSMIGGRSGNRGRCAQPCRLPYTYLGKTGAWLSPRDLCARDQMQLMAEAGVYSFKIEGRLKRPEYVAVVTRAYRKALDEMAEGRFAPMEDTEKESLTQIFSRGGFTKGYPGNAQDAGIIDPRRVTPEGVEIGAVSRVFRRGGALLCEASLKKPLHDGDGLEIAGQPLRYAGPSIPAGQNAVLRLRESVRPGDTVRRTEDESQLAAARATYEGEALNSALPIPFEAALTAYPGKPLSLAVTDGESRITVQGDACPAAESKPLDGAAARRSLEKTGGTPFALKALTVKTEGAFVPAAALNELRREALSQLTEARIAAMPRLMAEPGRYPAPVRSLPAPRLIVKTARFEEIPALLQAGADEVLFQSPDDREASLLPLLKAWPRKARLCLPAQCRQDTLTALKKWTEQFGVPVCLSSPGQLEAFPGAMAGEGVPVMNGEAVRMLSHLGCESVTLSRELAKREIAALPSNICELILPVYGRARLMLLNHCPMRTARGLTEGKAQCALCEASQGAAGTFLTDRMGARYPLFPLRLPEGCLIELMADLPLDLSGELNDLPPLSCLVCLTDEEADSRPAIVSHFAALLKGEYPAPLPGKFTWGRFREGVI